MKSEVVGLIGVVQLVNRRLQGVLVIQAMVLLVGLGERVRQPEKQDPGVAAAKQPLLDLDLKSIGAIVPGLNQVVGYITENRVRPQQILGANRSARAKTGSDWQNAEERVGQRPIQVRVVRKPLGIIVKTPSILVVAQLDIRLIVPGKRYLRQYAVRQLSLEPK